jgi:hypothetical protein
MGNKAALLLLIVSELITVATPFSEGQAQAIASPEVFTEAYLDQVPVSGSILTGLQYSTPSDSVGRNLWIRIPRAATGKLCISVITDDGRYSAAAEFNLSALSSGEPSSIQPSMANNYENILVCARRSSRPLQISAQVLVRACPLIYLYRGRCLLMKISFWCSLTAATLTCVFTGTQRKCFHRATRWR